MLMMQGYGKWKRMHVSCEPGVGWVAHTLERLNHVVSGRENKREEHRAAQQVGARSKQQEFVCMDLSVVFFSAELALVH